MNTSPATLDAGQVAVLESIATGVALPQVLNEIVLLVERQAEGMICSILLLDEKFCLRHGAAPHLPEAFKRAIDGSSIGPAAGSCGTAAFTKQRVVIADIDNHPFWTNYKEFAVPFGLLACWSTPIVSPTGEVLGTFAMYYRERREPTQQELDWVALATHLAAIAIGRERAERALRRSERRATELARLHAVSSAINQLIARARDLQSVYDRACRAAVQLGLARLAWLALRPSTDGSLDVVAEYGTVPTFNLQRVDLTDERHRGGLAARAIATKAPVVSGNLMQDVPEHWRDALDSRGLRSCAVFPLITGEEVIGVFALCADTLEYFRTEEVQVLTSVAADISFAIEAEQKDAERRRMQEAVRASEQLRALIFDTVAHAMFYLQVEGENRYRFVSVNRAFHKLFSSDDSRIVNKFLHELLPDSNREPVLQRYRDALASHELVAWEEEVSSRAGINHVEITIAPIFDASGRGINFVGIIHDITARTQAEADRARLVAQLNQAQRMQSLGTLAGGIAHDFNNILAAIRGNAAMLLEEAGLQPSHRTHVLEIQKASLRAIELVRQILTFSRHAPPKRETLDPGEIATEALNLLRATLPQTIALETDIAPNTPRIEGDPTQFHQVVMNLCTNAAHALPPRGGVVRIRLDRFECESPNPEVPRLAVGSYLRLRVSDNGCGMDEATLKRAFDPFFTTRQPGEGTGLGLSVVHGIVESHQGTIEIRSELGAGTQVAVYLPASVAITESKPQSEAMKGHGERVMYVDDEEALVFLIDRALSKMGYRVSGFSDATLALAAFRSRPNEFDVVITDVSMPGLSGPDLAVELRRVRADVPIVMTSGYLRPEDVETAERIGINQLIYKANTIEELGAALAREIATLAAKTEIAKDPRSS